MGKLSPITFQEDYAVVFQQQIRAFRDKLDLESEARFRDRISELPDDVLCRVLSLLPTKYVVRTSILAKRWKNIWKSVPSLYFSDLSRRNPHSADFVEHVLLNRDNSPVLQKFHLDFVHSSAKDHPRIEAWLRTVSCKVVELYLAIGSRWQETVELPETLVTSKTLKILNLSSRVIINFPASGCFPSLQFLHINVSSYKIYSGDEKDSMDLCQFPVLEHLTIDGHIECSGFSLNISVPELKTLRITMENAIQVYDSELLMSVNVNAPKLEKLDIKRSELSDYNLKRTNSLVEANIQFSSLYNYSEVDEEQDAYCAAEAASETNLLSRISMVKYLTLTGDIHKGFSPSAFDHLKKLTLPFVMRYWEVLFKFLEKSPNLEGFVIDDGNDYETVEVVKVSALGDTAELMKENVEMKKWSPPDWYVEEQNWSPPEFVPKCLLRHLKTISIKGIKGVIGKDFNYQDQMDLIKYMLKNGRVLETMTIYSPGLYSRTINDFYSEIATFECASKSVRLEIVEKIPDRVCHRRYMVCNVSGRWIRTLSYI